MVDEFNKPIQPIGPKDREKIYVSPVEADKLEHEGVSYQQIEERKKQGVAAFVVVFFKKILNAIRKADLNRGPRTIHRSGDSLVLDLEELKVLLLQLKERDQSENPKFAIRLSERWCSLMQHAELAQGGQLKSSIHLQKLEKLLNQIGLYPFHGDHLLGYYLKQHAGKDWLPFPFMEILRKLHKDFYSRPELSDLQEWLNEIDSLLPSFPSDKNS